MLRILPLQLKLGKSMALADTVMTVTAQDAGILNARIAVGDHMYFTLMDVRGDEVVAVARNMDMRGEPNLARDCRRRHRRFQCW